MVFGPHGGPLISEGVQNFSATLKYLDQGSKYLVQVLKVFGSGRTILGREVDIPMPHK